MNKLASESYAKRLCPEGWECEVWENCGWHVGWKNGPVCVRPTTQGRFFAFVAPEPDDCGYGGPWTNMYYDTIPATADTILEAAANEIKRFKQYCNDHITKWVQIRRACDGLV